MQAGFPRKGAELALQITTILDAPFGKPGRNNNSGTYALAMTFFQVRRHVMVRHDDADQVSGPAGNHHARVRMVSP